MRRFFILIALLSVIVIPACAQPTIDPETGEEIKVKVPPPTKEEVKALAFAGMRLGLNSSKLNENPEKLEALRGHLQGVKGVLSAALASGNPDLTQIKLDFVESIDADLAVVIDLTLGIVVGRVRPLIDQGKTDEAAGYLEAAIDGALLALGPPPEATV